MLTTICCHALLPVGSPLTRNTGSPFSATTVDVSLASSRKSVPLADAREDQRPDEVATGFTGGGDHAVSPGAEPFRFESLTVAGPRDTPPEPAYEQGDLRLPHARAPPYL